MAGFTKLNTLRLVHEANVMLTSLQLTVGNVMHCITLDVRIAMHPNPKAISNKWYDLVRCAKINMMYLVAFL